MHPRINLLTNLLFPWYRILCSMNVYQVLIVLLVVFIIVYEMVPAAQAEIRDSMRKSRRRLVDLRQFIDDDDYDAVGRFQHSPFSMREYLDKRERCSWDDICERARRRRKHGWGCAYWDGPDYNHPYEFWWQDGCMVRRRHDPKTHAPIAHNHSRKKSKRRGTRARVATQNSRSKGSGSSESAPSYGYGARARAAADRWTLPLRQAFRRK